ncbi:3461_t:CDS:1, partial [Acaulospora colombiana]
MAETQEILGGYNPVAWDKTTFSDGSYMGSWVHTNKSFIFSLKNGNICESIVSRVKAPDRAIYNYSSNYQNKRGPNFGGVLYMASDVSDFTLDK